MTFLKPAMKHEPPEPEVVCGCSLPPCVQGIVRGKVILTVNWAAWNIQAPPQHVKLRICWWGDPEEPCTGWVPEKKLATAKNLPPLAAIFLIKSAPRHVAQYLGDMKVLRLELMRSTGQDEGADTLLGICSVNVEAFHPFSPLRGIFPVANAHGKEIGQLSLGMKLLYSTDFVQPSELDELRGLVEASLPPRPGGVGEAGGPGAYDGADTRTPSRAHTRAGSGARGSPLKTGGGAGGDSMGSIDPDADLWALLQGYLDRHKMRLVELFRRFDKGRKGFLAQEELQGLLRLVMPKVTNKEARYVMVMTDSDGSGGISYKKMAASMRASREMGVRMRPKRRVDIQDLLLRLVLQLKTDNKSIHEFFHAVDFDCDGLLDYEEVEGLFRKLLPALSPQETWRLVSQGGILDPGGDGSISIKDLEASVNAHLVQLMRSPSAAVAASAAAARSLYAQREEQQRVRQQKEQKERQLQQTLQEVGEGSQASLARVGGRTGKALSPVFEEGLRASGQRRDFRSEEPSEAATDGENAWLMRRHSESDVAQGHTEAARGHDEGAHTPVASPDVGAREGMHRRASTGSRPPGTPDKPDGLEVLTGLGKEAEKGSEPRPGVSDGGRYIPSDLPGMSAGVLSHGASRMAGDRNTGEAPGGYHSSQWPSGSGDLSGQGQRHTPGGPRGIPVRATPGDRPAQADGKSSWGPAGKVFTLRPPHVTITMAASSSQPSGDRAEAAQAQPSIVGSSQAPPGGALTPGGGDASAQPGSASRQDGGLAGPRAGGEVERDANKAAGKDPVRDIISRVQNLRTALASARREKGPGADILGRYTLEGGQFASSGRAQWSGGDGGQDDISNLLTATIPEEGYGGGLASGPDFLSGLLRTPARPSQPAGLGVLDVDGSDTSDGGSEGGQGDEYGGLEDEHEENIVEDALLEGLFFSGEDADAPRPLQGASPGTHPPDAVRAPSADRDLEERRSVGLLQPPDAAQGAWTVAEVAEGRLAIGNLLMSQTKLRKCIVDVSFPVPMGSSWDSEELPPVTGPEARHAVSVTVDAALGPSQALSMHHESCFPMSLSGTGQMDRWQASCLKVVVKGITESDGVQCYGGIVPLSHTLLVRPMQFAGRVALYPLGPHPETTLAGATSTHAATTHPHPHPAAMGSTAGRAGASGAGGVTAASSIAAHGVAASTSSAGSAISKLASLAMAGAEVGCLELRLDLLASVAGPTGHAGAHPGSAADGGRGMLGAEVNSSVAAGKSFPSTVNSNTTRDGQISDLRLSVQGISLQAATTAAPSTSPNTQVAIVVKGLPGGSPASHDTTLIIPRGRLRDHLANRTTDGGATPGQPQDDLCHALIPMSSSVTGSAALYERPSLILEVWHDAGRTAGGHPRDGTQGASLLPRPGGPGAPHVVHSLGAILGLVKVPLDVAGTTDGSREGGRGGQRPEVVAQGSFPIWDPLESRARGTLSVLVTRPDSAAVLPPAVTNPSPDGSLRREADSPRNAGRFGDEDSEGDVDDAVACHTFEVTILSASRLPVPDVKGRLPELAGRYIKYLFPGEEEPLYTGEVAMEAEAVFGANARHAISLPQADSLSAYFPADSTLRFELWDRLEPLVDGGEWDSDVADGGNQLEEAGASCSLLAELPVEEVLALTDAAAPTGVGVAEDLACAKLFLLPLEPAPQGHPQGALPPFRRGRDVNAPPPLLRVYVKYGRQLAREGGPTSPGRVTPRGARNDEHLEHDHQADGRSVRDGLRVGGNQVGGIRAGDTASGGRAEVLEPALSTGPRRYPGMWGPLPMDAKLSITVVQLAGLQLSTPLYYVRVCPITVAGAQSIALQRSYAPAVSPPSKTSAATAQPPYDHEKGSTHTGDAERTTSFSSVAHYGGSGQGHTVALAFTHSLHVRVDEGLLWALQTGHARVEVWQRFAGPVTAASTGRGAEDREPWDESPGATGKGGGLGRGWGVGAERRLPTDLRLGEATVPLLPVLEAGADMIARSWHPALSEDGALQADVEVTLSLTPLPPREGMRDASHARLVTAAADSSMRQGGGPYTSTAQGVSQSRASNLYGMGYSTDFAAGRSSAKAGHAYSDNSAAGAAPSVHGSGSMAQVAATVFIDEATLPLADLLADVDRWQGAEGTPLLTQQPIVVVRQHFPGQHAWVQSSGVPLTTALSLIHGSSNSSTDNTAGRLASVTIPLAHKHGYAAREWASLAADLRTDKLVVEVWLCAASVAVSISDDAGGLKGSSASASAARSANPLTGQVACGPAPVLLGRTQVTLASLLGTGDAPRGNPSAHSQQPGKSGAFIPAMPLGRHHMSGAYPLSRPTESKPRDGDDAWEGGWPVSAGEEANTRGSVNVRVVLQADGNSEASIQGQASSRHVASSGCEVSTPWPWDLGGMAPGYSVALLRVTVEEALHLPPCKPLPQWHPLHAQPRSQAGHPLPSGTSSGQQVDVSSTGTGQETHGAGAREGEEHTLGNSMAATGLDSAFPVRANCDGLASNAWEYVYVSCQWPQQGPLAGPGDPAAPPTPWAPPGSIGGVVRTPLARRHGSKSGCGWFHSLDLPLLLPHAPSSGHPHDADAARVQKDHGGSGDVAPASSHVASLLTAGGPIAYVSPSQERLLVLKVWRRPPSAPALDAGSLPVSDMDSASSKQGPTASGARGWRVDTSSRTPPLGGTSGDDAPTGYAWHGAATERGWVGAASFAAAVPADNPSNAATPLPRDELIGRVVVDLTPLLMRDGLDELSGWYHIIDARHREVGQLKLHVDCGPRARRQYPVLRGQMGPSAVLSSPSVPLSSFAPPSFMDMEATSSGPASPPSLSAWQGAPGSLDHTPAASLPPGTVSSSPPQRDSRPDPSFTHVQPAWQAEGPWKDGGLPSSLDADGPLPWTRGSGSPAAAWERTSAVDGDWRDQERGDSMPRWEGFTDLSTGHPRGTSDTRQHGETGTPSALRRTMDELDALGRELQMRLQPVGGQAATSTSRGGDIADHDRGTGMTRQAGGSAHQAQPMTQGAGGVRMAMLRLVTVASCQRNLPSSLHPHVSPRARCIHPPRQSGMCQLARPPRGPSRPLMISQRGGARPLRVFPTLRPQGSGHWMTRRGETCIRRRQGTGTRQGLWWRRSKQGRAKRRTPPLSPCLHHPRRLCLRPRPHARSPPPPHPLAWLLLASLLRPMHPRMMTWGGR
eukprot:jgi/Mesvir1/28142/Mv04710-RA.1